MSAHSIRSETTSCLPFKDHQAIGRFDRQGFQEYGVDYAEQSCVRANAERQGKYCNRGDNWTAPQHTCAITQVAKKCLHEWQATLVPIGLLHLLHTAEFPQRCMAGFLGAHSVTLIVLNLHLEMRLDLVGQFLIETPF